MAQVIVRNLDENVLATLKRKSELHGCSLEQELRDILSAAARLKKEECLSLARRVRALTPTGAAQTDSAKLIRADRDAR